MSLRRLPRLAVATIAAALLSVGLVATTPATAAAPTFSDVPPSHSFYKHVTWLAEQGLVNGYGDGTFRPGTSLTRGQFAVIVFKSDAPDDYVPPATPQFSDVPTSHPFYKHISWLAEEGVVSGFSDGTFRPGASLTRGQLAVILTRAIAPGYTPPPTPRFSDVPTSHSFYKHVWFMVEFGVVDGFPDGTFRPNSPLTRGQFAVILYRAAHPSADVED